MKKRSIIRSALCLVLAAVLCLSMAACGRTQTPADEGTTSESSAPLSSALPVKALQPKQVEENPYMAKSDANIHHDGYNTDSTDEILPLGIYAERFRMISNAMADLKEHKSRIKQVYQENELVSQRLKAASIAMSAYAAELTEWDQSVVYQLVEKVTVLAKDKIRVTFRNGTEVEQEIEQLDWRNAS